MVGGAVEGIGVGAYDGAGQKLFSQDSVHINFNEAK